MPILDDIKNITKEFQDEAGRADIETETALLLALRETYEKLRNLTGNFLQQRHDTMQQKAIEEYRMALEKADKLLSSRYLQSKIKIRGYFSKFSEILEKQKKELEQKLNTHSLESHPATVKAEADVIAAMTKAYDEKYQNKTSAEYQKNCATPKKRADGSYLFPFPNVDVAEKFCETQAQAGLQFIIKEEGKDYATGCNFYSCGDGVLYSGTSAEIVEQMQKSMEEHQSDPEKLKTTTAGLELFKSLVTQEKLKFEMKSIAPAPSADPSTTPSPGSSFGSSS